MHREIEDITIVGGGDSGLLAALCLRTVNPEIDVRIVDDFRRDVPQVGKSTYLKIRQILHDTLDIDERRFVSEVKPVWKAAVYFRDWCGSPPFHYPFDLSEKFPASDTPRAIERYYHYYDELADSPDHRTKCEEIVAQGKSPWYFDPGNGQYANYEKIAYHLDTERFNSFLRNLCEERGVRLIDDEITTVDTANDRVERLRGKRRAYESDLYVDASGFNRIVKGELNGEFVDFELPLDAAFNARVDHSLDDVVPATVIDTGESGWFWQIDTFDDRDLGYVYASEYASDDEALAEFLDHCGESVAAADVTGFEFTSGYYRPAWEENCVAIGNAEGFVEPLESTGLTANAHAAVKLSNLLSSHGRIEDDGIRDAYNAWVHRSWESIHDFISVHYRYAAGDTEFWRAMRSRDVSPRVELLAREFDRNGFDWSIDPTTTDPDVEPLSIFRPVDFYALMRHMGATSTFYESNDFDVGDAVEHAEEEYYRNVREDVDTYLTVRELYDAVVGQ